MQLSLFRSGQHFRKINVKICQRNCRPFEQYSLGEVEIKQANQADVTHKD